MSEHWYQVWLEERRAVDPPDELSDRVMRLVTESQTAQRQVLAIWIANRVERSRLARYLACITAMLIGSVPFVTFVAYLLQV